MTTVEKTAEARIADLEAKVSGLASCVGRLTAGIIGVVGGTFEEYDNDDGELTWHEELCDVGTEDEALVGWWTYKGAEASVDA